MACRVYICLVTMNNAIDPNGETLKIGTYVSIVAPDDASEVLHVGTVVDVSKCGSYVGVQIEGETRVDEWPVTLVYRLEW